MRFVIALIPPMHEWMSALSTIGVTLVSPPDGTN
jgi:hypothetical protein